MKAINILGIYESLATLVDKDLNLNTACNIAKNLQALSIPKQLLEQKRNQLIQEYGQKDADGNLIQGEQGEIKLVNEEDFRIKLNEIFEEDIDVDLIKLKKSALEDIKISPKTALGLIDILEEER